MDGAHQDPDVRKLFARAEEIRKEIEAQWMEVNEEDDEDDDLYEDGDLEMADEGQGEAEDTLEDETPVPAPEAPMDGGVHVPSGTVSDPAKSAQPVLHRYRSKASTVFSPENEPMSAASKGTNASEFSVPPMTEEQKEELAAILRQIQQLQLPLSSCN